MHKTSFIEILRALDKDELKRFDAFLSSPYFNTKKQNISLFNEIKKYAPEFSNDMLAKEELWKKLFPEKEYNYGFFKNIIYDITRLAEQFLQTEYLNSDKLQQIQNLLDKLSSKKLDSLFMNKFNFFEKSFFDSSKFYEDYYADYSRFKYRRFVLEAYNPRLHARLISTDIGELMILDFMARFSNQYNNIYIEETELNEMPGNDFIKNVSRTIFGNEELERYIDKLAQGNEKRYKHALIFFKLMKSYLNSHSIDSYFEFKKVLFENDRYFSESAMRGLYASLGSALDNCDDVKKVNKNKELYDIIIRLISKNIFTSADGKVVPTLYLLSVKIFGYLKKPDQIEKLMQNFLHKTDSELIQNFEIYSLAFLHYSKNEFEKSLEYTNRISIDTFQLKYILKNLQIIISFEKDDHEMFLYLYESQKKFLSKNKSVSSRYKTSNMKFLNYTNLFFKLRHSGDDAEIGLAEEKLLKDAVVNKHWLLDKLNELRG